jgi:tRNA-splicing ligase RtcB (3'-phosphate/5'-hydroxy nucleic acid ligase)
MATRENSVGLFVLNAGLSVANGTRLPIFGLPPPTMAKSQPLVHESDWKRRATWIDGKDGGYFHLETGDTGDVPVRLFVTDKLLTEAEPTLYRQIINATHFPGVRMVCVTPDVHYGYGVPVGCVILTDREEGTGSIAMGPVGFDIGCGMMSARSKVDANLATPDRKLEFNQEVSKRVALGAGGRSVKLGKLAEKELQNLVRGGAEYYVDKYGASFDRGKAERHRIPVSDQWDIPWGGRGNPERGLDQLGSLGGGNHFIELQRCEETKTLFVQVHTGSRGFGHGLATNYFQMAKDENAEITDLDLGFFTPESKHFDAYLNAVAAGGNYAILNRLIIYEQIAEAFRKVFKEDLELVYEISHNLVQAEEHPDFGKVWVHRKGATRAFPAKHPALIGTQWEASGHPVLIPGSNRDFSYILMPEAGAHKSGFSVNHGAGRRLSRGEAIRQLDQRKVDEQYRRDGILVNLDGRVPLDESNACYKSAEEVVTAVVAAGLARIEYTLWPLASIKGNEEGASRDRQRKKKEKDRSRDKERDRARRTKGHF